VTSIYAEDPRLVRHSPDILTAADEHRDRWHLGVQWTIWDDGGRWEVYDPDCRQHPDLTRDTLDDTLGALLGPPLWAVEAAMLLWARENAGWLPADPEDDDAPAPCTVAGSAAVDNLQHAACRFLRPHAEDSRVTGYRLTEHGWWLADQLHGQDDDEIRKTVLAYVPQQFAYGVTEDEDV
jgi:hypothetical protein